MKRINCGDLVPGCGFKAQAATEAEVLHEEADHARQAHGLDVSSGFIERARARIEDVTAAEARSNAKERFAAQ
jgi:predicted small metal-binding protein